MVESNIVEITVGEEKPKTKLKDITLTPESVKVKPNEKVKFTVGFFYDGAVSRYWQDYTIYVDGEYYDSRKAYIEAGNMGSDSFTIQFSDVGSHEVTVKADSKEATSKVEVVEEAEKPHITRITISAENDTAIEGDDVAFQAVFEFDKVAKETCTYEYEIYRNDELYDTREFDLLSGYDSARTVFTVKMNKSGFCYVKVKAGGKESNTEKIYVFPKVGTPTPL